MKLLFKNNVYMKNKDIKYYEYYRGGHADCNKIQRRLSKYGIKSYIYLDNSAYWGKIVWTTKTKEEIKQIIEQWD
jgi:hypothetical protein